MLEFFLICEGEFRCISLCLHCMLELILELELIQVNIAIILTCDAVACFRHFTQLGEFELVVILRIGSGLVAILRTQRSRNSYRVYLFSTFIQAG